MSTLKCPCGGCGSLEYIKTIACFYQPYHFIAITHAAYRDDAVPVLTYLIEIRKLHINRFQHFKLIRHKKTTREAKTYLKTNAHLVLNVLSN